MGKLTAKLFVSQILVLILTIVVTCLMTLAYLQDLKWVDTEREKFKSKYNFWFDKHGSIAHNHSSTNNGSSSSSSTVHTHPNRPMKNIHDHAYSPKYIGTLSAALCLFLGIVVISSINLGLFWHFKSAKYRRIYSGTIHLAVCWMLFTATNIAIGQLISIDFGYVGSDVRPSHEWIVKDYVGCRISQSNAWKKLNGSFLNQIAEVTLSHTIRSSTTSFYHNKSTSEIVQFIDFQVPDPIDNGTRIISINNMTGALSLEEYGYSIGLCQLWKFKLASIVLSLIALLSCMTIVHSSFHVYKPGEVEPEEVVAEEQIAFVEVWVDDNIDDKIILEFADTIEQQEWEDARELDEAEEIEQDLEADEVLEGEIIDTSSTKTTKTIKKKKSSHNHYLDYAYIRKPSSRRYYVHELLKNEQLPIIPDEAQQQKAEDHGHGHGHGHDDEAHEARNVSFYDAREELIANSRRGSRIVVLPISRGPSHSNVHQPVSTTTETGHIEPQQLRLALNISSKPKETDARK